MEQRERLNFGFGKLERLRGNVGYLELVNFSELRQQSTETASASVVDPGELRCDYPRPAKKQRRPRPDDGIYRELLL